MKESEFNGSFNPEELTLLTKVLDEACAKLGCDDAQRATIASRIVSFASTGTRDYETLLAVATFQSDAIRTGRPVPLLQGASSQGETTLQNAALKKID